MGTLDIHVEIGTGSGDDRDPGRPHLDEAAYRALDLTQVTQGPVRYDTVEARWLSDVAEATPR